MFPSLWMPCLVTHLGRSGILDEHLIVHIIADVLIYRRVPYGDALGGHIWSQFDHHAPRVQFIRAQRRYLRPLKCLTALPIMRSESSLIYFNAFSILYCILRVSLQRCCSHGTLCVF